MHYGTDFGGWSGHHALWWLDDLRFYAVRCPLQCTCHFSTVLWIHSM